MSESLESQLRSLTLNDELESTYDDIVKACPKYVNWLVDTTNFDKPAERRFRILLIGRSGVGKSALINAVFGSGVAIEEHGRQPGVVPDINHEFSPPNNPRLVLHDSQGFLPGNVKNLDKVLKFIRERGEKTKLEDRLHIIWWDNFRLCTEFPMYGASLFEMAEETIYESPNLKVPIVAVFTKFDKPVAIIKRKLPKTDDQDKVAQEATKKKFEDDYAEALAKLPNSIPRVEVSSRRTWHSLVFDPLTISLENIGYQDTLRRLVYITEKEVKGAMSYIWASSQFPSADLKIKASIHSYLEYWSGLSRSLNIPGRSLNKWLEVVLRDLVSCWGFDDPQGLLKSNLFKTKITTLQEDLLDEELNTLPKIPLGAVAAVAGIVSGVIPPAAPFAIPIAAGLVFAAWVYKAYLTAYSRAVDRPQVLRGLMGYIIDLTIVMQSLFWLTRARAEAESKAKGGDPIATVPLSKRLVELAYTAYATDEHSRTVHEEIRQFVKRKVALKPDLVLDQIVKLIETHRFRPSKGFQTEAESEGGTVEESVSWDTGNSL
ncbi:hypothetical protein K438DRAFT_1768626 [Mycena galopus ATCC 62051]|nr:hypothetical protein K438DRAFT_1768626 [Mycena galopus ATCC 62051]